jgi:phage terminase large subunit-like protein
LQRVRATNRKREERTVGEGVSLRDLRGVGCGRAKREGVAALVARQGDEMTEVEGQRNHMTDHDIRAMMADPAEFRRRLLIDCDDEPKADIWDDFQRRDFESLDPACRDIAFHTDTTRIRRAWIERPRGHSKTLDTAVLCCWLLIACRWPISGIVVAGDRDQARLLRRAVEKLVYFNPWLSDFINPQKDRIVNEHTKGEVMVVTSDVATGFGENVSFIVCDEITHWRNAELWELQISTAAKRPRCLLICIGNAGWQDSWVWPVREGIREMASEPDSRWYFSRLDGPVASWITEETLAEQRKLLPRITYERLWLNIWVMSRGGDALEPHEIERAIRLRGPILAPEGEEWIFAAGLDLSSKKDRTALAVVCLHVCCMISEEETDDSELDRVASLSSLERTLWDAGLFDLPDLSEVDEQKQVADEDEKTSQWNVIEGSGEIRLARLDLWEAVARAGVGGKAEVDFAAVETAVREVAARYNCPVYFDPWNAAFLAQRCRAAGVEMVEVPFSGPNKVKMCTYLTEAFQGGKVAIYEHVHLINDLRNLRAVEREGGVRLESPRSKSGHGDSVTSMSLATYGVKQMEGRPPRIVQGELLCSA